MSKLQIALFSSEYPPHILGGLGTHVDRVTAALEDSVVFELFLPERGDYRSISSGIRLHEVPVTGARSHLEFWLRFCQAVVLAVEQSGITVDLIHCHEWMTVLAGIRLRRMLGVPLVYNVHLPQASGATICLENLGLVAADLVLVNSQAVRQELIARGLPLRQIEVVPNGVDLTSFCPAADWPVDNGYVLFVGRLVPQKGVDLLLQAFGVVLRRCSESHLVIVGDGDLELYLQRLVRYLGFPHRVSFVNWQTGPALVELYQRAQVVVVPSYYEPFGIVALEAMACGRPVIAARVGGLQEIVEDGVQGYLVPVGDYLQLARRLGSLILDSERRQQMGKAARARATEFAWHEVGSRTMTLYASLAGKPAGLEPVGVVSALGRQLLTNIEQHLRPLVGDLLKSAA